MARKVETPLTLTLAASGLNSTLYVTDIQRRFYTRDFNRDEWSNTKLQGAQDNTTFARPQIVTNSVNAPIQISIETCGFDAAIPLGPDDNNLSNILQKMNITEYEITGGNSSPTSVNQVTPVADDHQKRLDLFEYYLATVGQNVSYQFLLDLRNQNYSFLTSTGLTLVDSWDYGTINNCLIKEFNQGLVHLDFFNQTAVTKSWKMVVQQISITTRAASY